MWGTSLALLTIALRLAAQDLSGLPPGSNDRYYGIYSVSKDHTVGVDRFVLEDTGESVLLFSDYESGIVRRLFPVSDTEFAMGPGFNVKTPVELRVKFITNQQGAVTGLSLQPAVGSETFAKRIGLKEEPVTFRSGDATLQGTLMAPATTGRHPAIVLLHGSGPLTRYSFGPYPHFFNSLGLAVLIYDKRGTGASSGTRLDASTGTLMDPKRFYPDDLKKDALAALTLLQKREDINGKEIGFWGSSEGGMLAIEVAAESKGVAFIIDSSGFMTPLWETILYQSGAVWKDSGVPQRTIDQSVAFTKMWLQVAKTGKGWDEFRRAQQEGIENKKGVFFQSSREFASLEQMRWDWNHILTFSPLPALKQVRCPVLAVYGEADRLTPVSVTVQNMRRALSGGGNKDFTIKVFPNAGHSLGEAPAGNRMAPGVFDTLRSWLLKRLPV
jgi:pimeloyl-ACP methyl ester carboxylesterase